MYRLIMIIFCSISLQTAYAQSTNKDALSNPLQEILSLASQDTDQELMDEDVEALRKIIQNSNLYHVLIAMNMTMPNMTKVSEYVLAYDQMHQMNRNLEQIVAELKKINQNLEEVGPKPNLQ